MPKSEVAGERWWSRLGNGKRERELSRTEGEGEAGEDRSCVRSEGVASIGCRSERVASTG